MTRPPLPSEVLSRYATDKNSGFVSNGHTYGHFYDSVLPRYRWCRAVLEIGILNGDSLRCWAEFFPDAEICGIDNDRNRLFNTDRIHSYLIDCGNVEQLEQFATEFAGYFNVLIDDGSHKIEHQLNTVRILKKTLRPYGLMVIEDVATPENGRRLEAEGCRIEEWDVHRRHDNRIAYLTVED